MNKQVLESYYLLTSLGLSSAKGRVAWRNANYIYEHTRTQTHTRLQERQTLMPDILALW